MTEDEARQLALRCIDTWPSGPKSYVWQSTFLPLQWGFAKAAYKELVSKATRTPVPGQFMEHYRALIPSESGPQAIQWKGDEIGLDEYLAILTRRSAGGSQDATDELERWKSWLEPKASA